MALSTQEATRLANELPEGMSCANARERILFLVEMLQRDYRVTIAGPTTMAAILNSFQLGFRSLALQQSSGEVWETLEKVRTEFGKFNDVLEDTQHRLDQAQKDLEQLVGARTRSIQRSLDKVSDYTDYKDNTHGQ